MAQNPQDQPLSLSGEAPELPCGEMPLAGAETMQENVTQDANPPTTEEAHTTRRLEKRARGEGLIDDVKEEMSNQVK
eukprot:159293-Rhodomonas_salina.1